MISPAALLTLILAPTALAGPLLDVRAGNMSSSETSSMASSTSSGAAPASTAASPSASASSGSDVAQALQSAGLNNLASLVDAYPAIASALATGGPKAILAPVDDAFAALPSSVTANTSLVEQILQYHVINSTIAAADVPALPTHILGNTTLQGGPSNLINGSQPVVLGKSNATHVTVQQPDLVANVLTTDHGPNNLTIYPIDHFLTVPQNLTWTLNATNITGIVNLIGAQNVSLLESVVPATYFIPTDEAIQAAQANVSSLTPDQIAIVVGNHVGNQIVYSTTLNSTNATSISGQPLTFGTQDGNATVTSGNATAKIVRSDLITANGVVHLIDTVLLNTQGTAPNITSSPTPVPVPVPAPASSSAPAGSESASAPASSEPASAPSSSAAESTPVSSSASESASSSAAAGSSSPASSSAESSSAPASSASDTSGSSDMSATPTSSA